jgi:hypothetical protein
VTLTRKRVIEEKIVNVVEAIHPDDALAVTEQLIRCDKLQWTYNRTLETEELGVDIKEVKSK